MRPTARVTSLLLLFAVATASAPASGAQEWAILPAKEGVLQSGEANCPPGGDLRIVDGKVSCLGKPLEVEVWSPAPSQVEEAEARLPGYLRQQGRDDVAKRLGEYRRQYVGFTRAHRRLIYLNVMSKQVVDSMLFTAEFSDPRTCRQPDFWRHEMPLILDGGDHLWHAEYDPDSRQFAALQFNGVA